MKDNLNRAGSTLSSLIVWLSCALIVVAFGIFGVITAGGGLITGWVYSFGIVLNDTTKIYKSNAPTAFWFMIWAFAIGGLIMTITGVMLGVETTKQYKKTRSQKRSDASITR